MYATIPGDPLRQPAVLWPAHSPETHSILFSPLSPYLKVCARGMPHIMKHLRGLETKKARGVSGMDQDAGFGSIDTSDWVHVSAEDIKQNVTEKPIEASSVAAESTPGPAKKPEDPPTV